MAEEKKQEKVTDRKQNIHIANISQNWKKIQKKALAKVEKSEKVVHKRQKKQPDTRPLSQQIFDPPMAAYSG